MRMERSVYFYVKDMSSSYCVILYVFFIHLLMDFIKGFIIPFSLLLFPLFYRDDVCTKIYKKFFIVLHPCFEVFYSDIY